MSDRSKITAAHTSRAAFIYLRQSSPSQVLHNRESTERQYALVARALELGWAQQQIVVVDEDLGLSGSGTADRSGFARMTAEVALSHVGIVLSLEVSRVARNNAEWYRLLDLCGITNTLIGDGDGLYHPGQFNDRLLLGLKGTMSEAELHILRARLDGGIRNKAARGELRRGLPVGLVWGDKDGEVQLHPDQAIIGAIQSVFDRFAEMGSARQVWLWFRSNELLFPLQSSRSLEIQWISATYTAIHHVLTNPAYAGAYAFGKTRQERYVDESGRVRTRCRHLPRNEWPVLITDHHKGFVDWETYETIQARLASNTRPQRHDPGGAVREGAALLQGVATCGRCGRHLRVYYQGRTSSPGYHCPGNTIANGRGVYCLRVGGRRIDDAVAKVLLEAITPAGVEAGLAAEAALTADHDAALGQWRLAVERARYEADRAERRHRAVEPENRLVARTLESEWNQRLGELEVAEAELGRRQKLQPHTLTAQQRETLQALGADLEQVWSAPTTTDRDRKELLRTLLEEVVVAKEPDSHGAHLTLRWRGGAVTELDVDLPQPPNPTLRTEEDTVDLIRRLAAHYHDATIAGILNRQGRRTVRGERFTAAGVASIRRYRKIPSCQSHPQEAPEQGQLVNVAEAAKMLGVATSTLHRWLNDGFIAGEQLTPGAPWRIRITQDFRARFVDQAPEGWVGMFEAMNALAVSRQTVLQRVKRGELESLYVREGRRKGLRIKLPEPQRTLFDSYPPTQASQEEPCQDEESR
jgi:DNA invertase Pin-like site-specific DNA recombinase